MTIGLAWETPPFDVEELLQRSDAALYSAKRAGRNQMAIFER